MSVDERIQPEPEGVLSPTTGERWIPIIGLEVPHVHIHLIPIDGIADLDFSKADTNPDPADLDAAADKIRAALRELGYREVSD